MTCANINMFPCNNGGCVEKGNICDFTDDCLDLSDEDASLCNQYQNR